jgi:hypothetical protein
LYLEISSDGRFTTEWMGCTDRGQYQGKVSANSSHLNFQADKHEPVKEYPGELPEELIPIPWGKRVYLVESKEIPAFCNAVNLGLEPRARWNGRFFLRMEISKKAMNGIEEPTLEAAEGLPRLPAQWVRNLLKRPVRGEVSEVLRRGEARITLGSRDGIVKGLRLFVFAGESRTDPKTARPYTFAEVQTVDASTSTVKALDSKSFRGLDQGDFVSSRMPKEIVDRDARSRPWLWLVP